MIDLKTLKQGDKIELIGNWGACVPKNKTRVNWPGKVRTVGNIHPKYNAVYFDNDTLPYPISDKFDIKKV